MTRVYKESKIMGEGRRHPWLNLKQHFPQLTDADERRVIAFAKKLNRARGGA